jgi:hypothetical protein
MLSHWLVCIDCVEIKFCDTHVVIFLSKHHHHHHRIPTLEVSPHGNAYLRLWFNGTKPGGDTSAREVFLFLNDESGQSEESFLFTIHTKI